MTEGGRPGVTRRAILLAGLGMAGAGALASCTDPGLPQTSRTGRAGRSGRLHR